MTELTGKYNSAKVFATIVEEEVIKQIYSILNCEYFKDSQIRIMPDTHAGTGAVIGFTANVKNRIIPNIVGVDIACGMSYIKLPVKTSDLDLNFVDQTIRKNVPAGFNKFSSFHYKKDIQFLNPSFYEAFIKSFEDLKFDKHIQELATNAIGTLGGGNHFIELNANAKDEVYLVVHSGSRNYGLQIAKHFQNLTHSFDQVKGTPKDLYGLPLDSKPGQDYLKMASVANDFAKLSRMFMIKAVVEKIAPGFFSYKNVKTTIHNYIEKIGNEYMIRKGAISAKKDEEVLIPLNMRDGSLICEGKGNNDWNNSAPHGAGRIMARGRAKRELSMMDYQESMKNVFTTCVSKDTLDESPMVYKDWNVIQEDMQEAVEVIEHIRPIYNFKAGE